MLLCHFVFDTTFTLLRRWRRGKNIVAAHRSHLYQRLVIAGWRYRDVTLLYLGLALRWRGLAGNTSVAALLPPLDDLLVWRRVYPLLNLRINPEFLRSVNCAEITALDTQYFLDFTMSPFG